MNGPVASAPAAALGAEGAEHGFSARLLLALALCAMVLFVDGYDLAAMPLVLPYVVDEFGIPPADFGFALSAVLVGLGVGAILLAPLGDRHGRRPTIIVTVALIGLVTIGTTSASSVTGFSLWRFLNGLMLGACLPNVTAQVAQWAPESKRASTLTIVSLGISLGGIVAGLVVPPLVALGGWRAVFLLPGIGTLALALLLLLLLPRAGALPERREDAAPRGGGRHGGQLLSILRPPLLTATAVFVLLYGLNAFSVYLTSSWVPTLLPQAGFSLDLSARYISVIQLGGLVVGLLLAWLLDRGRVTWVLTGAYAAIVLAFLLLGMVAPDPWVWGLLLFVSAGGVSGVHLVIIAIATDFFPARYLATALGFGVAVARIGAIGGPMAGAWLIGSGTSVGGFFLFAALPAAACLVAAWLIPMAQRARLRPYSD